MSIARFIALILVFGSVSLGWMALGGSVWVRTEMLDDSLSSEMDSLWGPGVLAQGSPYWAGADDDGREAATAIAPSASAITADVEHEIRRKGLLLYSTFTVKFNAHYTIPANAKPQAASGGGFFIFPLPAGVASYAEKPSIKIDEDPVVISQADVTSGRIAVPVDRQVQHVAEVSYVTGGQNIWLYSPGDAPSLRSRDSDRTIPASGQLSELNDFSLTITTDFSDIDYPRGTRSPNRPAEKSDGGMTARWQYENALTAQAMGIVVPKRPNAGPIIARMSFFAPVSLFFFFAVLFTVVVLKRIPLHPMHYLFIAAGFFAFHILLAYLADHVPIHPAFWICAAVSTLLVVSYMRLVAGVKFAVAYAGLAQVVYLVGFSYAFFWVGMTGLTVTIGAIVTLFVLMQATGRVNWFEVFRRRNGPPGPPPLAAGPDALP